jgi:hypothetical protein
MPRVVALDLALLLCVFAAPSMAADQDTADLLAIKHRVQALHDLADAGVVTKAQVDQGEAMYVAKARIVSPECDSLAKVMAVPETSGEPSDGPVQKLKRLLSLVNIVWVGATVVGVVSAAVLAYYVIPPLAVLFALVPLAAYEAALAAASLGAIVGGLWIDGWGAYVGFAGCLGVAGTMALSGALRKLDVSHTRFFGILTVVWSVTAVLYHSQLIGFAAVAALMGLLGFSAAVLPLCYVVGFKDDASVPRATFSGLAILAAYVAFSAAFADTAWLAPFSTGALFLGSFVGYLGLLIMSSRWYVFGNKSRGVLGYAGLNLLTVAAGVAAIVVGTLRSVPQLQQIGGTFFCLYLLEKPAELPVKSVTGWAFVGLVVSGVLYWASALVTTHAEAIQPYLLF